jgi:hypothetical protein
MFVFRAGKTGLDATASLRLPLRYRTGRDVYVAAFATMLFTHVAS